MFAGHSGTGIEGRSHGLLSSWIQLCFAPSPPPKEPCASSVNSSVKSPASKIGILQIYLHRPYNAQNVFLLMSYLICTTLKVFIIFYRLKYEPQREFMMKYYTVSLRAVVELNFMAHSSVLFLPPLC